MKQTKLFNKIGDNKVLIFVSYAEFWDVFSFFGTAAIMVLYMTKVFNFSDNLSYTIYGIYLALLCGLPVIGGILVDKFIGYYHSLIFGSVLMIVGNLSLLIQNSKCMYFGLAATICGTALYKTSCTSLIGGTCDKRTESKNMAYTFFYAVINCGAIFGAVIYGIIAKFYGWHWCFLFSAVGLFSCLYLFLTQKNIFNVNVLGKERDSIKVIFKYCLIGILVLTVTGIFFLEDYFDIIFFMLIILTIGIITRSIAKYSVAERRRLYGVVFIIIFCIFFFAASLQVGSSLTLFLNRAVNRNFLWWNIPTTFFTSLDPLFVVLSAPVFTLIWNKLRVKNREPFAVIKLMWGLILCSTGFVCFWLSAQLVTVGDHYVVLFIILFGYVFIGAGEICLTPAVLSTISDYSPKNIVNTMTGTFYLSMAFAGYLGSAVAKLGGYVGKHISSQQIVKLAAINEFSNIFMIITIITIVAAAILFVFSRFLNKLFYRER